jgi:hypothetical protein
LIFTGSNGVKRFVVVSQDGLAPAACSYNLSAASSPALAATGTTSSLAIVTAGAPSCPWTAETGTPWITLANPVSGTTTSSVNFAVAPNTGPARTGSILVRGLTFTVNQASGVVGLPIGEVDQPTNLATGLAGAVPLTGWAVDDRGFAIVPGPCPRNSAAPTQPCPPIRVEIWRDALGLEPGISVFPSSNPNPAQRQVFIGYGTFVRGARPDIRDRYSNYPDSDKAGWGYLLLTNRLPAQGLGPGTGTYTLRFRVIDNEFNATDLPSRTVTINNATSTLPFGTIDTPAEGETISGDTYVNFGWVLTPLPKTIPKDGSTLRVLVDGEIVGVVNYNYFRPDIADLFPNYNNAGGAIGFFVLNTLSLANGLHQIAWVAFDDAGAGVGLGSRYFNVQNGASSAPAVTTGAISAPTGDLAVSLARTIGDGPSGVLVPDADGVRHVDVAPLDLIELTLGDGSGGATYEGFVATPHGLEPLPVGSTLRAAGTFVWHIGPAFLGTFDLIFVRRDGDGQQWSAIRVTVKPRGHVLGLDRRPRAEQDRAFTKN